MVKLVGRKKVLVPACLLVVTFYLIKQLSFHKWLPQPILDEADYSKLPSPMTLYERNESYDTIQNGVFRLVQECIKNEPTFIPWDFNEPRREVDLRVHDLITVVSLATGLISLDEIGFANTQKLEEELRTRFAPKLDSSFNGRRRKIINFVLQSGITISPHWKDEGFLCYPVVVDIPPGVC
jgi:hypothetical protein